MSTISFLLNFVSIQSNYVLTIHSFLLDSVSNQLCAHVPFILARFCINQLYSHDSFILAQFCIKPIIFSRFIHSSRFCIKPIMFSRLIHSCSILYQPIILSTNYILTIHSFVLNSVSNQ